jgi:hypothetical protein
MSWTVPADTNAECAIVLLPSKVWEVWKFDESKPMILPLSLAALATANRK